jgi:hypothetical protein
MIMKGILTMPVYFIPKTTLSEQKTDPVYCIADTILHLSRSNILSCLI